jgi:hypothetical protein
LKVLLECRWVTDFGAYLFARATNFRVLDEPWLGWASVGEAKGVLFNGGGGASFAIPLKWQGLFIPLSMNIGAAFFQSQGGVPAETYFSLEPGIGLRYRATPMLAAHAMAQSSYMIAFTNRNRNIGSWNFSIGIEVALAPHSREPLQHWVPPLITTAQDVVRLLRTEPVEPLNILDRNLDFINSTLKPLSRVSWYPFGFRGIVQGTIVQSSRAATGNITALDIELDAAPRSFRVWRTRMLLDSTLALQYQLRNGDTSRTSELQEQIIVQRIKRGDYAYRPVDDHKPRHIRVELFPWAKGPLDKIPTVGSRVSISGELLWDGDGHMELHPLRPADVRVISGDFLYSDDEKSLE